MVLILFVEEVEADIDDAEVLLSAGAVVLFSSEFPCSIIKV